MTYPPVLSFGAGVNSTALAILLINGGWRGHIVFADTGTEWPDTYCFMDYFEREWLRPRGFEIVRLGKEWRADAFKPTLIELCEAKGIIPDRLYRWCTDQYKIRPNRRWRKKHGCGNDDDVMIGIASDEALRMMSACRPLVDKGIDRAGCVRIIQEAGLDVPPKSGCYICRFQPDRQWRDLWRRYPELFARATRLEETSGWILAADGRTALTQRRLRYESQMPLLDPADMDELLEYRPCVCHL
jgi:hypothetical protein